jgi:hypothetical protein
MEVTYALGVSIPNFPPSIHSAPTFKHAPHDGTAPSQRILRLWHLEHAILVRGPLRVLGGNIRAVGPELLAGDWEDAVEGSFISASGLAEHLVNTTALTTGKE